MINVFEQPVSSWDVLERVKELVREEPKRMAMSVELVRKALQSYSDHAPLGYPRCGAVGCIGGWSGILLQMVDWEGKQSPVLADVAERMGLDWETQASDFFYPVRPGLHWSYKADVQTPEYAERVIKHIKEFQQLHKRQLKAHMCRIGPEDPE